MEVAAAKACLQLVASITTAVQGVGTIHQKCRSLGAQIQSLQPLLEHILQQSRARKTFHADNENALKRLREALQRAWKTVQELKTANQFKMAIISTSLNNDLKDVSSDIQMCLGSLNLVTLGIQGDIKEHMKTTIDRLGRLEDDFREQSRRSRAEFAQFQKKFLDALLHEKGSDPLQLFADMYSTDRESIKADLQDFKEWRTRPKSAEMDLMFEHLLFDISELDKRSCHACAKKINSMQELQCSICKMLYTDPVIAIPSGHTYCRKCVEGHLARDKRCPVTREVVTALIPNRVVDGILKMPEHRTVPKPRFQHPVQMDVPEAAKRFQARSPGGILEGLKALQAHSGRSPGKSQIIRIEGLVRDLVDFSFSTNRNRPPGTLEFCLLILEDLTALRGPPEDVLTKDELEVVYICLQEQERGLEHLVTQMCDLPSAAQVMVNIIEGSSDCFCLATTLTGLVAGFCGLARDPANLSLGLYGLSLLAHPEYSTADNHGQEDEVLVGLLLSVIRNGIGVEETLVALVSAVTSLGGGDIFPTLLEGATRLVSLIPKLAAGHGLDAAVKILLLMAEDAESKLAPHQGAVAPHPLLEILKSKALVQRLLNIIKELTEHEDRLGRQEDCILLLGHSFKHGGFKLEPDQLPFLVDILLQGVASDKSRIQILEILELENKLHVLDDERVAKLLGLAKPQAGRGSTLRRSVANKLCSLLKVQQWCDGVVSAGGVETFCSVAANDDDELCRSYAIIALERLATTDEICNLVGERLSLRQLLQVLQSPVRDEARGAAAALIGMLISNSEPERVITDVLVSLVEFLETDSPHREKAAEALAHLISKTWVMAREWVVGSEANVLVDLVQVARTLPPDSRWRGQLYGTLSLMSSDTECQNAVIGAQGQVLLLEALLLGSQPSASAALALAVLLVRGEPCPGVDLDRVVKAIKGRLKRPDVDPVMVEAFATLCGTVSTGTSVVENGGIKVLLDVIRRCPPECQSPAALGVLKLTSQDPSQLSPPETWKSQIVEEDGVAILLASARDNRCVEAAEALSAVAELNSAQANVAGNLDELCEMCRQPGRAQGLLLKVITHISPAQLSLESVSKLTGTDFPDRLLTLLKTPASPPATAAVVILRQLCLASPVFRRHVLLKLGAIQALLQVLVHGGIITAGLGEIREQALGTLEVLLEEETETGTQHFLGDGVKTVADVLQNCATTQEQGPLLCAALKVLLRLSDQRLGRKVRKRTWKQICNSQIFGAVAQALDLESSPDCNRTAIQLLDACVQETSHMKALCTKLRHERVLSCLAKLLYSSDVNVSSESYRLVTFLAKKSRKTKKILDEESKRLVWYGMQRISANVPNHN